jgi:hypothetical protein
VTDRRRKLAFASAAGVLLGITVFSTLREPGPPPRHAARPQQPADISAIRTEPLPESELGRNGDSQTTPRFSPAPSTSPSPAAATQGEREAKSPPAVAPREARAATAAARAFLDGYLPYSYGQSDAGRIRAAAGRLLRELEASPPRVPATVAQARPRLIYVRARAATSNLDVELLAVVEDGQRRYRIPLVVRHAGHRWIVTAVDG